MEIFKIENFSFTYPNKTKYALSDISLNINSGDFVVICGSSGCGKTTLLKNLKPELSPHGKKQGNIYFQGEDITKVGKRELAESIGYVLQNPDNQIITDKVYHELAFSMENLGYSNDKIRLRVAEMASFFGIQNWFYEETNKLSGGQKQILNLASVVAVRPEVIILDEPSSQLDPIAASEFLSMIEKINRELGITIILTEHRLDDVVPLANHVICMEEGQIIANGSLQEVGDKLKSIKSNMFCAMPSPMQIYSQIENDLPCPTTVRQGRAWVSNIVKDDIVENNEVHIKQDDTPFITIKDVWFKYEKNGEDILNDLSVNIPKNQIYAVIGGNGTGKTTMLNMICGIHKPYRGKIKIDGVKLERFARKIRMLPQNPQTLFAKETVIDDLCDVFRGDIKKKLLERYIELTDIPDLLDMHPYDLSGGEQQRVALCKVLLSQPDILLLDEPTKGLDAWFKIQLGEILNELIDNGKTIIIVSHDIEFCAKYADKCGMFFNGSIITENNAHDFFSGNSFYTTGANRMVSHVFKNVVTNEEAIKCCKANLKKQ